MFKIPDAAVGAVAAALIAGIISMLGLIISKEQKTSDFRQAWIDALRNDLTAYLTQINAIHDAIQVDYPSHAEKVATLRPLYLTLNISTFDILLRVNPDETKSRKLLNAMKDFNMLTSDENELTTKNIRSIEADFLRASQALLKFEWGRVKSGEWTFRIAKLLAAIVILVSVTIGALVAYRVNWYEVVDPVNGISPSQSQPLVGTPSTAGKAAGKSSADPGVK